ncbi:MarR family transcriptional regulator [Nonomuraea sp. NPDC050153]|uniref:MarR family transcriptional regulator n=1 Tax=Nonomuraea sp. NPDC050153 TaxID=3364359 RepID=UPI00379AE69E
MLRIHVTPQDLLHLRFAPQPAPMVELTLAVMMLRRRRVGVLDRWRHRALRAFPPEARPLLELAFPDSGPEYLDTLEPDFDLAVDAVLSAPPQLVRMSLDDPLAPHPVTPWARRLALGDREAQLILERALRSAHAALLDPVWRRVVTGFRADLAHRTGLLLSGGVGTAMASVFPDARWHGNVLEISAPGEHDVHLNGSGAVMLPVAFWTGPPVMSRAVPGRPRLVMYPARIPLPLIADDHGAPTRSLTALLGRTRASVLHAVVDAPASTTSELARHLNISPGRASEHAAVLREGGLITSHRHRNTVLHSVTELGRGLLG